MLRLEPHLRLGGGKLTLGSKEMRKECTTSQQVWESLVDESSL